jgi:hypothetical protein
MGAYRGRAPNFLGVIGHSFWGGPPEIPSARERHILASEGRAIAEVAELGYLLGALFRIVSD